MEFDTIVLSKDELSVLRELEKARVDNRGVPADNGNKAALERLMHFEFARVKPCSVPVDSEEKKRHLMQMYFITDRGRDYLAYLENKKKERRSNRRHDVMLLLISALIALLLDHLQDIWKVIRSLF